MIDPKGTFSFLQQLLRLSYVYLFNLVVFNFIFHVQRFNGTAGAISPTSEKFYLKEVSPEEILKIEYEEKLLKYAHLFDLNNALRYEENKSNISLKQALQATH
jgi:hypothetical protein